MLDLLDTGVEVAGQLADLLHHLRSALLNVGHHFPDFTGRGCRTRGESANLVSHHREATAVFPGPRRFDCRVQGQQVGLTGDGLDHQGHTLDVIAAQAQGFDQLTAAVGALAELMHARNRFDQLGPPCRTALMRLARSTQGFTT
ncbi:hypothetical protein D3C71_1068620 [compost metagenome]